MCVYVVQRYDLTDIKRRLLLLLLLHVRIPFSSDRQHLMRGDYQNRSVLYCVLKLDEQFLQLSGLGFVSLSPFQGQPAKGQGYSITTYQHQKIITCHEQIN